MKYFFLILTSFISLNSFGYQISDSSNVNSSLTKDIDEIQNLKNIQFETEVDKLDSKIVKVESDLKELMNLYIYFAIGIFALTAGAVRLFGLKAIKKRVEEIISDYASKIAEKRLNDVLQSKITDQLIEKTIKEKVNKDVSSAIKLLTSNFDKEIERMKIKSDELLSSFNSGLREDEGKNVQDSAQNKELKTYFDLAFNSDKHDTKVKMYTKVISLKPDFYPALHNLANSMYSEGLYEETIKFALMAIKVNPSSEQTHSLLAQGYLGLKETKKALAQIEKSLLLNKDFAFSYSIKGEILAEIGDLEPAGKFFNKALEIDPENTFALTKRGYFFYEQKKYDQAISDYLLAEEIGYSNLSYLYNNIAVAYRFNKDIKNALKYIDKAIKMNFINPNTYGTLALIYADQGNEEKFYENLILALENGCKAWKYIQDSGFDNYRDSEKLKNILKAYKE